MAKKKAEETEESKRGSIEGDWHDDDFRKKINKHAKSQGLEEPFGRNPKRGRK
jgi:hypothetical protein